jgi:putative two-component system response regulator
MRGLDLSFSRILIVDDQQANVDLLEQILGMQGYQKVASTTDPRQVTTLCHELNPDLILLDLHMPYVTGMEVIGQLRGLINSYLPILVLTADITPEAKRQALTAGANDFLSKPFDVTEVLLRVGNLLETRYLYLEVQNKTAASRKLFTPARGRWEPPKGHCFARTRNSHWRSRRRQKSRS